MLSRSSKSWYEMTRACVTALSYQNSNLNSSFQLSVAADVAACAPWPQALGRVMDDGDGDPPQPPLSARSFSPADQRPGTVSTHPGFEAFARLPDALRRGAGFRHTTQQKNGGFALKKNVVVFQKRSNSVHERWHL